MNQSPDAVRVAVAGCGQWGGNLVRTFHALGALAAVHDPDPTKATAAADAYCVPARTFEDVLADTAIDGVVIAAPAVEHATLARRVLGAGKHAFVEKPLALDLGDADELCELAEAHDRVLMVGHLLQYHPAFQALDAMVADGVLGRLQYVYSNRLNFGRIRREENILWSFAPHDISMMLRLARCEPHSVSAVGSTFLQGPGIADVTTTQLSFPNGVEGHLFVSWLHPFKEQKLVVIGDRGMAVFDDGEDWDTKLLHYPHVVAWRDGIPTAAKANPEPVALEPAEPLMRECEHFLACVANGATPRTDGQEALRVLRVLDAASRSMRTPRSPQRAETVPEGVFVHQSAFVDQPAEIGAGTKIWHFSHVLAGSRIGRACVLGQNVMVGPDVTIGDGCRIQNNVSVYKGVTLEDGVFCGPSAVFTNVLTPRAEVDRRDDFVPTRVERGASIGANATIVCGITVGAYSMIGAGAVVTRDVPPHGLMAGVPARRIGWVSHAGERLGDDLVCPRTGRRYRETPDGRLDEDVDRPAEPVVLVDLEAQRARLGGRIERAIRRVIDHKQFILGPEVEEFERRLADYCGAAHAVSCASGTDALLLPLLARGLGPGQAVFVPSFTFPATPEVVALTGATPFFVDVDDERGNLDPWSLDRAVAEAEMLGLRPVGVIPVDLYGHPADYATIRPVADRHGLSVIADAAQSFGASLDGGAVGTLGHATAVSFFPSKPLGCYGDGGAVLTDDAELAAVLRSLRGHGRGTDKYDIVRVGVNSRLDTIQAAVLLQKLDVLAEEIDARRQVAERYAKGLGDVVRVPEVAQGAGSAWAQYTVRLLRPPRDEVAARLHAEGIPSAVHYPKALHHQPAFSHCPRQASGLRVSELLASEVLSLPMHPYLTEPAQDRVIRALREAVAR